ncbi:hypothetical protein [Helicobacter sp. 13S00477-4]|uniref:hypothetical protein n=1 Tax=Helicobacter sp. 13S00477-4 TaxID=1905759 RepID=UPI000BA5E078|nr:hypothetical protein [Helicobacter sp. 13S00477-4]PAF52312.1 hypothetical protein BKH44_03120 [Helicobacter sp. 13S00477-4]
MQNRAAFALFDFLMSVVVMSVIGIVGSKMLLNVQKQNHIHNHLAQKALSFQNTLDMMRNYLLEAQKESIVYKDYSLSWKDKINNEKIHNISLRQDILYLDGFLALVGVKEFRVFEDESGFEIVLCDYGSFCAKGLVRLWDI